MSFYWWGWRVGVWLSDPENVKGLRKLRPRVELHFPLKEDAERCGYRAETIRPLRLGNDACIMQSVLIWNVRARALKWTVYSKNRLVCWS